MLFNLEIVFTAVSNSMDLTFNGLHLIFGKSHIFRQPSLCGKGHIHPGFQHTDPSSCAPLNPLLFWLYLAHRWCLQQCYLVQTPIPPPSILLSSPPALRAPHWSRLQPSQPLTRMGLQPYHTVAPSLQELLSLINSPARDVPARLRDRPGGSRGGESQSSKLTRGIGLATTQSCLSYIFRMCQLVWIALATLSGYIIKTLFGTKELQTTFTCTHSHLHLLPARPESVSVPCRRYLNNFAWCLKLSKMSMIKYNWNLKPCHSSVCATCVEGCHGRCSCSNM